MLNLKSFFKNRKICEKIFFIHLHVYLGFGHTVSILGLVLTGSWSHASFGSHGFSWTHQFLRSTFQWWRGWWAVLGSSQSNECQDEEFHGVNPSKLKVEMMTFQLSQGTFYTCFRGHFCNKCPNRIFFFAKTNVRKLQLLQL